jgi:hypothetical protein
MPVPDGFIDATSKLLLYSLYPNCVWNSPKMITESKHVAVTLWDQIKLIAVYKNGCVDKIINT